MGVRGDVLLNAGGQNGKMCFDSGGRRGFGLNVFAAICVGFNKNLSISCDMRGL